MRHPVVIFVHIGALDIKVTQPILNKMFCNMQSSGLYETADKIYCGIVGKDLSSVQLPGKVEILFENYDASVYEIPTINQVRLFAENNPNWHILYMHTKGATNKVCDGVNYQQRWSDAMQYFCIHRHKRCIDLLDEGYDTVGCLLQTRFGIFGTYYCGNFWWASSDHIRTRPHLLKDSSGWGRSAEFWLIPKVNLNVKVASLYNSKLTRTSIPPCAGLYGNALHDYETTDPDLLLTPSPLPAVALVILLVTFVATCVGLCVRLAKKARHPRSTKANPSTTGLWKRPAS